MLLNLYSITMINFHIHVSYRKLVKYVHYINARCKLISYYDDYIRFTRH